MCRRFLSLCFAILFFSSISFAKIWRVNNTGGGGGDFATAQAANDGASVADGDTIHLEPSPNSYGQIITNKRLVWISTGAFLAVHPTEQYSLTPAKISNLYMGSGASNSVFSLYIDGQVIASASNIRLERCYVTGLFEINNNPGIGAYTYPNNVTVINCYGEGYLNVIGGTNHFVSNNIFSNFLSVQPAASAVIQNNVFNAVSPTANVVYNSTLQNNIFNKATGAYTFTSSVVQYNMSGSANVLPAGNFNQNGVNMANVFVNNNGTDDAAFVLKAGSPAIGSGASGANMGAYGGTTPFKLGLQPAIPAIYKITAPFAPTGNTMNVTISTKSNN